MSPKFILGTIFIFAAALFLISCEADSSDVSQLNTNQNNDSSDAVEESAEIEPTEHSSNDSNDDSDPEGPVNLINFDLSYELIDLNTESTQILDAEQVQVQIRELQVEEEIDISSLLLNDGIFPDAEAFGALYRLNPELDINNLEAGATLLTPVVTGNDDLLENIENGNRLLITLDSNLKEEIEIISGQLDELLSEFTTLPSNSFPSNEDEAKTKMEVEQIVSWLKVVRAEIRLKSRTLNPDMLNQIHGEALLLEAIMRDSTQGAIQLTREEIDTISEIHQNMQARMVTFNEAMGPGAIPPKSREVLTRVKILDSATGEEIERLRVYFVSAALFRKKELYAQSFRKLTSPIEQYLPEANYRVWAMTPSSSFNDEDIVTDVVYVKIRKQLDDEPLIIELQLLK